MEAQEQVLQSLIELADGLVLPYAFVALEPQELPATPSRQDLGNLGLADAGFTFEQERTTKHEGEEDRRREPVVGKVVMSSQRRGYLADIRRDRFG